LAACAPQTVEVPVTVIVEGTPVVQIQEVTPTPEPQPNVMVVCKECSKSTRTGVRVRPDGVKVRVCKRCGADVD